MFDSETGTDRYIFTYRSDNNENAEVDGGWHFNGPTWETIKFYLVIGGSVLGAILHGVGGVALAYKCKLCTKHRFLGGFLGGATLMLLNLGIRSLRDYVQKSERRRTRANLESGGGGGIDASDVSLSTQTARDLVRVLEDVRACFEAREDGDVTPLRANFANGRARHFRGSRQSTPISVACPRVPPGSFGSGGGGENSPNVGGVGHNGAANVLGTAETGRRGAEGFTAIELAPIVH